MLVDDRLREKLGIIVIATDLPQRVKEVLTGNLIFTLRDVVAMTEAKLRELDGFGDVALAAVKELLVGHGLRLGMDLGQRELSPRDRRILERPDSIDLFLKTIRDHVEAALAVRRLASFNRDPAFEHHRDVTLARMEELEYIARSWALDRGAEV